MDRFSPEAISPRFPGTGGGNGFTSSFGRGVNTFARSGIGTLDSFYGGMGPSLAVRPATPGTFSSAFSAVRTPSTRLSPSPFATSGAGAPAGVAGGAFAALDAHNNEVNSAAQRYGVPGNLLKAVINRESSGNWAANNTNRCDIRPGKCMLPFVGVFDESAASVGFDYNAMIGNKQLQIDAMAAILARDQARYGSWEAALSNYLTGDPSAYQTGGSDPEGTLAADYYVGKAMSEWRAMDNLSGTTGGAWGASPANATGLTGNSVVQKAMEYRGTKYVWGAIPGKGQDPRTTGWDCSGFTYWLDQNYGSGSLPQGSHHQYEYAKQKGMLFQDVSQLQPGDLLFFDTGWQGGSGAELNPAGHVGLYIGNGKMLHAANENVGTIVSDLNDGYYKNTARFLGAMHAAWSGGQAGQFIGFGTGLTGYTQPGTWGNADVAVPGASFTKPGEWGTPMSPRGAARWW